MRLIGCDLHASQQSIAMLDRDTGVVVEKTLKHEGAAVREFYASISPPVLVVFERTFKEFGLPQVIRTDNGVPFASAHAIYGLSKLAVWWLRLGIERIKPGHPQQNGRHERMPLTLKREATKPAAANVLQQQARFDEFLTRYNADRPHQALGMKVPADLYARSARVYRGLEELTYPF